MISGGENSSRRATGIRLLPDRFQSTESRADSPLASSAPGEEAKEEQNDHQPPAVLTPQPELSRTNMEAEAQAELPKAPSDIMAVKRSNKEDMRRTQDRWNLQQQRGDQQNQNSGKKLQTELQETQARIKARKNLDEKLQEKLQKTQAKIKAVDERLEVETEIQRETEEIINLLLEEQEALQKRVEVLASHLAACKDFQQVTGNKEPQNSCEAQQVSQAEVLPVEQVVKMVEEKRTPCEEVEHLNKELQVAIKKIDLEEVSEKQRIVNEIMIMKRNRSPCVVTYLEVEWSWSHPMNVCLHTKSMQG
ncbi:hypothetical protein DUI87_06227 [Hirundo rustica rustica]|uniref:Uncharacterized protein n=1 Tax=Hirundo rustica rustica TaxID=333673 RepID=A0A3M0KW99_HIRRU|nr:hypothetical protein DUI87_06227 [Hirundo rustica rustica]